MSQVALEVYNFGGNLRIPHCTIRGSQPNPTGRDQKFVVSKRVFVSDFG